MKPITKEQITEFLKTQHQIEASEDLFTSTFEHSRFTIINDVCKHFTNNWVANGILIADDPDTLMQITYDNYNNFDHIKNMDDLLSDINKMQERKEQNMIHFKKRLDSLAKGDPNKAVDR